MRLRRFEFAGAPHPVLPDTDPCKAHRKRVDRTLSGGTGDQAAGLKSENVSETWICLQEKNLSALQNRIIYDVIYCIINPKFYFTYCSHTM